MAMKGMPTVKTWQLSRLEHLAFTEFMEMAEDAIFDPDYPANGSRSIELTPAKGGAARGSFSGSPREMRRMSG